jgi:3-oxoacyl-[acyl-carrier-protein] synthase-3
MAQWTAAGIRIAGISSAVPERTLGVADVAAQFGEEQAGKIVESVGVQTRHVVSNNTCTSDLCFAAAESVLKELAWEKNSIDALIFVTQTPDYVIPATSCALHGRLGLGKQCLAFDVNLGCSGYVYGLGLASRLVGAGNIRRALLLVGDTATRIVCEQDRSAAPLFGDAGTATAIEFDADAPEMTFDLGTDGNGADQLIIPAGSFRQPHTDQTAIPTERENGNIRSDEHLFMNGAEVFMFTLAEVPGLVKRTMAGAGWTMDETDAVILHQANAFMLGHLRKRMKIPEEKLTLALSDYGNTSSASIPLAITHTWAEKQIKRPMKFVLGGFGVGWSWAGAAVTCDERMVLPKLIIVPDASQYVGPIARPEAEAA